MNDQAAAGVDQTPPARADRGVRMVSVFLAVSYAVGAPVVALLEYRWAIFSQRFGYPAWLIYSTTAIQAACVVGLLSRRFAPHAAGALTVITLGAIGSHLRIGSPFTAVPALLYTVVQLWLVQHHRAGRAAGRASPDPGATP